MAFFLEFFGDFKGREVENYCSSKITERQNQLGNFAEEKSKITAHQKSLTDTIIWEFFAEKDLPGFTISVVNTFRTSKLPISECR